MMKRFCCLLIVLVLVMTSVSALAYEELAKGSKGEEVITLQNRLNELNYDAGTADGIYGNGTAQAVSNFQKKNNLEVTGIADVKTQEVLFSDDCIATIAYESLDWEGVSRNPNLFEERYVKFDGKVLQVINDYLTIDTSGNGIVISDWNYGLRVATRGNYDDVVFVVVAKADVEGGRILEDDKITVNGQYDGIYDYTTVLGSGQSIPKIQAESVVIK